MGKIRIYAILLTLVAIAISLAIDVHAANWYLDSSASGSNNGTSWTNAWTSINSIKEVSPGDTVYISGGPSGSTRTYNHSEWRSGNGLVNGSSGNPITYQIGQDSSHNGTAIFNTSGSWLSGTVQHVIISGDAGDGKMHFQLNSINGWVADCNQTNTHDLRMSYVDMGQRGGGMYFLGVTGIEIDHCYLYKTGGNEWSDNAITVGSNAGSVYDDVKIHHNIFYLPRDNYGSGDDGLKSGGNGISVYDNSFIGYLDPLTYQGGQHADGWQTTGGDYLKCYNNYFRDWGNYAVFFGANDGGFHHCRIYNNIIVLTSSALQGAAPPEGIVVGSSGKPFSFSDILVANNLVADYSYHRAIDLTAVPGSSYSNCFITNNAIINSGGISYDAGVTANYNIVATGSGNFIKYTPLSPSNNFHLLGSDTTFVNRGTSMAAYFTTDRDGVSRPQGPAWDIGPYEGSGSPTGSTPLGTPTIRTVTKTAD